MNYGRFFRLNQSLSKVVDGIAIYDYVDLPAYFGPSVDNPMSPKYPISVTITSFSVCFRLHYSAFKIAEKDCINQLLTEDKEGKIDFPQYAYNEDDINNKTLPKINGVGLTTVNMAHMEEVILELPYADNISSRISDTIRDVYNSRFPQVIDENTSMGGRFLEQLIKKRYPSSNQIEKSDTEGNKIEWQLYDELRKVSDDTVSYSTLWLMDLYKEGRIDLYTIIQDENTGKSKEIIIGFLRKLLLDFMFDLKHSDVFQNSANFQQMYSGLMENFYFSALMHKCEYYYYRILTTDAIAAAKEELKSKDDTIVKDTKQRLTTLYAAELFQAESLWMQDVMSPQAEEKFIALQPSNFDEKKNRFLRTINTFIESFWETTHFQRWPSWFAESEEEMRRICFKTKELETNEDLPDHIHICNADTLIELFHLEQSNDSLAQKLVMIRNRSRESASRWMLKRYDFNDVLHLHFFKFFNLISTSILTMLVLLAFLTHFFNEYKLVDDLGRMISPVIVVVFVLLTISVVYITYFLYKRIRGLCEQKKNGRWGLLVKAHNRLAWKRIINIIVIIVFLFASGLLVIDKLYWWALMPIILVILWAFCAPKMYQIRLPKTGFISKLHLFLPRPVAAITFAWFTVSMGFDLYVSFFDTPPSWTYIAFISVIVFMFIMYEINRVTPYSPSLRKVFRSMELFIISYFISLVVGFFIINFLGSRFLERGGFINDYYAEYVHNNKYTGIREFPENGKVVADTTHIGGKTDNLVSVYHYDKKLQKKTYSVAVIWEPIENGLKFYILPDFLIMFSFIAMFIGIFIQLIIFGDNRQMTEL